MDKAALRQYLDEQANKQGFFAVGVSKAGFLEEEARNLETWLSQGNQGKMQYLENHFDKRLDPTKLVPGAKTVISLSYNYFQEEKLPERDAFKIATYAYGEDYHVVIKDKLRALMKSLEEKVGYFEGRCFVDSAPVMERDWAKHSGLGWIGKHTLLLSKKRGSYFFLAEIISDLDLEADHPVGDHCGTCTKCIDACPTDAISAEGYILDASKCISYLTIELKEEIPLEFKNQMEDWIFGCDICQDVCPWNRFSIPHQEPLFEAKSELLSMRRKDWTELTEEVFNKLFKKSPVKRTKWNGMKRNIKFVSE